MVGREISTPCVGRWTAVVPGAAACTTQRPRVARRNAFSIVGRWPSSPGACCPFRPRRAVVRARVGGASFALLVLERPFPFCVPADLWVALVASFGRLRWRPKAQGNRCPRSVTRWRTFDLRQDRFLPRAFAGASLRLREYRLSRFDVTGGFPFHPASRSGATTPAASRGLQRMRAVANADFRWSGMPPATARQRWTAVLTPVLPIRRQKWVSAVLQHSGRYAVSPA